jgi:glycosyltransferase involved in cell wall biosynthesis
MRILFLTNYYPPYEIGGYEQLCKDVVDRLSERGHQTFILTSNRGVNKNYRAEINITRNLHIQPDKETKYSESVQFFLTRRRYERLDLETLQLTVENFKPDVIFIWNLNRLSHVLAAKAEKYSNIGVAYWLAGKSPAEPDEFWNYWTEPPSSLDGKIIKKLFRGLALRIMKLEGKPARLKLEYVGVVSEYSRKIGIERGIIPEQAEVIYNGVEIDQFFYPVRNQSTPILQLLQAGRISEDKGVHISINAIAYLIQEKGFDNIHLNIAGTGPNAYRQLLNNLVRQHNLDKYVTFHGWIPRNELPNIMKKCDCLLLPTVIQEAFSRVVLEAMASGLVVIASNTGGTSEIVRNNLSGLLTPADDHIALGEAIERIVIDQSLRISLANYGQKQVVENFSLDSMVDKCENLLRKAIIKS